MSNYSEDAKYDFLIIGHARGGTGYMSVLLTKFGYEVGHEKLLKNGTSDWNFVTKNWNNLKFKHIIHLLREPVHCIPSIILENKYAAYCYNLRRNHINKLFNINLPDHKNIRDKKTIHDIEIAALSFIFWHKICTTKSPSHTIKLENAYSSLEEFNIKKIPLSDLPLTYNSTATKKNYKERTKPIIDFNSIDTILKRVLNSFCFKYDYPQMYEEIKNSPCDDLPKCVNEKCQFRSRDSNFVHCCWMCYKNKGHGPLCENKLYIPLFIKPDILPTLFN